MIKNRIPVHWLSKEARYRIIDRLLSTRSVKELAEELGLSRNAIRKYINRETHPSDEVMERVFTILRDYEIEAIVSIVVDDLLKAFEMLLSALNESSDKYRKIIVDKFKEAYGKIGE
uniref:XRE family transcriptional regulator n=1 Tax=Staphylothermus marinus TaxID=2280 RepID=A0A7C4NLU0_STAMA